MAETGKIKWFNENKGYGFISQDTDGKDVFVHYSDIEGDGFRTLSEGEKVEYELADGPKGPHATIDQCIVQPVSHPFVQAPESSNKRRVDELLDDETYTIVSAAEVVDSNDTRVIQCREDTGLLQEHL